MPNALFCALRLPASVVLAVTLLFCETAIADINPLINNAEAGVFLLEADDGETRAATTLTTDVNVSVNGPIAHVTLTQRFHNTGAEFAEGLYVFPLSERAAVHAMEMQIGERRIVGEIREKAEARAVFEQARAEGKRTSLVEQRRANVFTTAVANIAPDDQIEVRLEYIEVLQREGNQFNLRFPMTLTPRYMPDMNQAHALDLPLGLRQRDAIGETPSPRTADFTDDLADEFQRALAGGTARPMADVSGTFFAANPTSRASEAATNSARISVSINSGLPVNQLYSRSHPIVSRQDGDNYRVRPQENTLPMDRDFLLSWTLAPHQRTEGAIFSETIDGEDYALLMLVPPVQASEHTRLPREMLFIIDTSGSMGGESIRQAKSALQAALKRLHPGDRFNIIEFNSRYTTLFNQPVAATATTLDSAQRFVARLDAGGGTEMLAPLKAAMSMPASEGLLRQIVFITDGAVGNEQAIFQSLHQNLGAASLFTVGIGSAPNSFFMRKSAEFGRGTFTYINSTDEVQTQMARLFARLEKPLTRNLTLKVPEGTRLDMFPEKIPDLYAGEPVTVAVKFNALPAWIELSGEGTTPWRTRLVPTAATDKGVSTLWARQKIEALTDRITRGESEDSLRPTITTVALRHKLLSRYTSFVAVDHTPARPQQGPLSRQDVANHLPKGLNWPNTATGVDQLWQQALLLALACIWLGWRQRRARRAQV